jgi:adenosine deaminase
MILREINTDKVLLHADASMCQSELHGFLEKLPKCEQHVHLEGALAPSLLFQLASRNEISLPLDDEAFNSHEALLARYKR